MAGNAASKGAAMSEYEKWLTSGDTGLSSITIYSILRGGDHNQEDWSIPYDPDDFGRCYRLLKRFPEWRARLPEVAQAMPEWAMLVREWDSLTQLWEEEAKPDGDGFATAPFAHKLYEAMQRCRTSLAIDRLAAAVAAGQGERGSNKP
jgi:hypothetical protein